MNANDQQQSQEPQEYLVGCIPLAAGDTLRVVDPRSVLVYVPQGRVWITEERSADDIVLDPGGWHRLSRPGAAVIEAVSPAVLMLTSPHDTGFARELTTQERPALPPGRTRTVQPPVPAAPVPARRRPSAQAFGTPARVAGSTG